MNSLKEIKPALVQLVRRFPKFDQAGNPFFQSGFYEGVIQHCTVDIFFLRSESNSSGSYIANRPLDLYSD